MTMVVVTHEMGFAREVATRVLFMDGGNIVEENDAEGVLRKSAESETEGFSVEGPLRGTLSP